MSERYREDYAGVHDFAVVGEEAVVYFRRLDGEAAPDSSAAADSLTGFDARAVTADSLRQPLNDPYFLPNLPALVRGLRTGARLVGRETLDGASVYVLEASDPAALLGAPPGFAAEGFAARVFVDAETFRLRGLRVETPLPDTTLDGSFVEEHRYDDFQTTDGLTLPFRSTTTVTQPVSEEQRIVQGGQLGLARQRAEGLPPAERERALRELDEQDRYLQTGVIEKVFRVREVRVGEGAPDGVFGPRPAGLALPAPPDGPSDAPPPSR
jgi:hypothetical protein